jgi:hypothetical protein
VGLSKAQRDALVSAKLYLLDAEELIVAAEIKIDEALQDKKPKRPKDKKE